MASHWKSTPTYWCKFCATYIRETPLERKNHEQSAKHQNNIQRSLRELHKTKEREDRDKQRAKDEVARLNGVVSGERPRGQRGGTGAGGRVTATGPVMSKEAQRKAHAEQLAALGVKLPEELQREVSGVGEWQTVSTRVIQEDEEAGGGMSMADILKQEGVKKEEGDEKEGVVKGVHKRRAEDEEEEEEEGRKTGAWGSRMKVYPGKDDEGDEGEDLDALLSGVGSKKRAPVVKEDIKEEEGGELKAEDRVNDKGTTVTEGVKQENAEASESAIDAPPVPVFKKRKTKK